MSADGKRPEGAERDKALELALDQIDKQFGKGSVMRLGDDNTSRDIDTVSSGSLGLDVALGVGGAMVVGGFVWWLMDGEPQDAVTIAPGVGGLMVGGRF